MKTTTTKEGYTLVNVRAGARPGYDGFWRAGVLWPSGTEGRTALVSPEVLRSLTADEGTKTMLFVDTAIDPKSVDMETVMKVDMPQRHVSDPQAAAAEESRRLEERASALRDAMALEERRAEVAELERKHAQMLAKKAAADNAAALEALAQADHDEHQADKAKAHGPKK